MHDCVNHVSGICCKLSLRYYSAACGTAPPAASPRPPARAGATPGSGAGPQPVQARLLVTVDVTAERARAYAQQPRCPLLAETTFRPARIRFFKPHSPGLLSPRCPSHPAPPSRPHENRTDHVFPTWTTLNIYISVNRKYY